MKRRVADSKCGYEVAKKYRKTVYRTGGIGVRQIHAGLLIAALLLASSSVFAAKDKDKKAKEDTDVEEEKKHVVPQKDTAGLSVPGSEIVRTADEGMAAEAFRLGVNAYYRGTFTEAAIALERALSFKNDDNLIADWLAKAYYRAGMEGEAIMLWQTSLNRGYGALILQNKIDTVSTRRITGAMRDEALLTALASKTYTEAGSFAGTNNGVDAFREPTSVLQCSDGSVWVVAYGSCELVRLNVNGGVFSRITGPLGGLDRPLDIIRLRNGNLLVSESAGDSLALFKSNGAFIKRIGQKGRAVGQFVGPQYLAEDDNGNIYVSDYGNRRVDVFDTDGTGLFHIGSGRDARSRAAIEGNTFDTSATEGKARGFTALKGPTGIAILGSGEETRLFVADDVTGGVYEFDAAGNFLRVLVEAGTFNHPESLKVWGSGGVTCLVLCDTNNIYAIDTDTGEAAIIARTGNGPARATSAVCDVNGNMLITDMKANEVLIMSDMSEVVGGLFTQIEKVHSEKFPQVTLEVRVEDRHRRAIVGLREENFHVTEAGQPVLDQKFAGAASNNDVEDVCIIIDRSRLMTGYDGEVTNAVREIAQSMAGKGMLRIVCAGEVPVQEYAGPPDTMKAFETEGIRTPLADTVPLDKAVRLASDALINGEKKRAIIFITQGEVTQDSFDDYTLSQTAAYLNNNAIAFAVVDVTQSGCEDEVSYLVNNTEGGEYYVFRPNGLSSVVADLLAVPSGLYEITYTSQLPTNLGEAYLHVEAETYLLGRSGKDETGYFAPLQ